MKNRDISLQEIADFLNADLHGDGGFIVSGLASLQSATSKHLSFIANAKYRKFLDETQAGAVIVTAADLDLYSGAAIVAENPYLAYAKVSHLFAVQEHGESNISSSAVIDETADVSESATLGPGVVIGARAVIAAGAIIGANSVIAADSVVGKNTRLEANVTVYRDVYIGDDCLVHSGAVLGADGFGFANDQGQWQKIAQLGGVRIGNRVEIGACTTIDRGAMDDTVIEDGVILDNQIQIAHNVQIGKNSAIAGCTAVAGSTKIGERCTIAGACGITGHLSIADESHITAMSLVTKSITEPGAYSSGTGMQEHKQWKKSVVRFRQLDDFARRLKSLEDKIIESKGS